MNESLSLTLHPRPWITPTFTNWTLKVPDQYTYSQLNPVGSNGYNALVNLWNTWYTDDDFAVMETMGLNSIRLPGISFLAFLICLILIRFIKSAGGIGLTPLPSIVLPTPFPATTS